MPAVVILDGNYELVNAEISGGMFVTEDDFDEFLAAKARAAVHDTSEEE
jgi:hypothetical protein